MPDCIRTFVRAVAVSAAVVASGAIPTRAFEMELEFDDGELEIEWDD